MRFLDNSIAWLRARIGSIPAGKAFKIQSLRFRFQSVVALALLPVAALSIWQGIDRLRLDQEIVRDSLRQSAYAAASDELNVFVAAEQILRTLSNSPDVRNGGVGCRSHMRQAIAGTKFLPNMLRVSADGKLTCSAFGDPSDIPVGTWWAAMAGWREFMLSETVYSAASGRRVLYGVLPLFNSDGSSDGALSVAISVDWLDFIQSQKQRFGRGAVVALFDKAGTIVVSNDMGIAAQVFALGTNAARGPDGLLTARDADGEAWSYAIAPVIRRDYYVGFSMKSAYLFRFTYVHVTVDLLLPVLMMVLASLAIWSVTDRVVVRSIELLQRTATAYGKGHYAIRPAALTRAPDEFRVLGESLAAMAQAVQERDKNLRDALDQKAVLIKEIHHRVKNSLQIVMSLLSLQANRLRDDTARDAIEQARTRVNALALVHRMIYELDRDGLVDLKMLLSDVVEQLHQGFGGDRRGLRVRVQADSYRTQADIAIPLTLFAVEAITNAYKHGFEKGKSGNVLVSLTACADNRRLKLTIQDDGKGMDLEAMPGEAGTGSRLIAAFANQVGGHVFTRRGEHGGTVVELEFPAAGSADASPLAAQ